LAGGPQRGNVVKPYPLIEDLGRPGLRVGMPRAPRVIALPHFVRNLSTGGTMHVVGDVRGRWFRNNLCSGAWVESGNHGGLPLRSPAARGAWIVKGDPTVSSVSWDIPPYDAAGCLPRDRVRCHRFPRPRPGTLSRLIVVVPSGRRAASRDPPGRVRAAESGSGVRGIRPTLRSGSMPPSRSCGLAS